MAFNLDPYGDAVQEIRQSYAGETPPPEQLMDVAADVQQHYVDGESAIVGNITTYEGVQSTVTRRPLSASVDLVIDDADADALGERSDASWQFKGAYFAAVDGVEVAVMDIDSFELFDFPENTVTECYEQTVGDHDLSIAAPAGNIASKFNRLVETQHDASAIVKGSDPIDMASHLHWYHTEDRDMTELAGTVGERVEPPYEDALAAVRNTEAHFKRSEREDFHDAVDAFEEYVAV